MSVTPTVTGAVLRPRFRLREPSVLPGFGLTLGFALTYLSLIVLIPLGALLFRSVSAGPGAFVEVLGSERVRAALYLSFGASAVAATVNAFLGFLVAWVLVRYEFPGRGLIDAAVDLPFAMPTAVSGIALTAVFAPTGWIGQWLEPLGIKSAYSALGVAIALTFVSLPFVVRTVQPALADADAELEEAAASLGASRWQTFRRVVFPTVLPALLTGFTLALARSVGEYGSVVFIAGNKPNETEIAPLLIMMRLDEYDYVGATVIATVMLAVSFVLLLAINLLQGWSARRLGGQR